MDILQLNKIDDCENIYSINPLYLFIIHANEYIEEKGANKYLIFVSTDENKELLKNIMMLGMELETKNQKNYSDDDLPLNKQLKFHNVTITIRYVFEENAKLYPQVFLGDTLYELNV